MVDVVMDSSLSAINAGEQHILISVDFPKSPFNGQKLLCFKVSPLHEKEYVEDISVISMDLFSRLAKTAYSGYLDTEFTISHDFKSVKIDSAEFTLLNVDPMCEYIFLEGTKEDPLKIRKTKRNTDAK